MRIVDTIFRRVGMLVVVFVLATSGCSCNGKNDEHLKQHISRSPFIGSRLARHHLDGTPSKQDVAMDGIRVGIPVAWEGAVVPKKDGGVFSRLEVQGNHLGNRFEAIFAYRGDNWSYVNAPSQEVLDTIGRFYPNPKDFLETYKSDVELLTAVYDVTPTDWDKAKGADARKIKTLLLLKINNSTVTRLDLPLLTAFSSCWKGGRHLSADICDRNGQYVGIAHLSYSENMDPKVAEQVFWQLLANTVVVPSGTPG